MAMGNEWYDKYWKSKETNPFVDWFEKEYGLDSDYPANQSEQEEYWTRRGFALMGWIGRRELSISYHSFSEPM